MKTTDKIDKIKETISSEENYKEVRQMLVDTRRQNHIFHLLDRIKNDIKTDLIRSTKSLNDLCFYCALITR